MSHTIRVGAAAFIVACGLSSPVSALTFNFSTIQGDTLTAAQSAAFVTAGQAWSSAFSDPVTVSVGIGFTSLGSGVLAQTTANFVTVSGAQTLTALTADAKSANDTLAVASFATQPPAGQIALSTAQARALGLATSGGDGSIQFSNSFIFATSRNSDGTIASNSFDLIGVAEHEIAHLLGFDSSIDGISATGAPTLLDEFRFTGANARTAVPGAAYFSLNDGISAVLDPLGNPANFSPGGAGQYQASHWAPGVSGIMVPAYSPGVVINATALDKTALDALGYDPVTAVSPIPTPTPVPEPGSLAVVLLALASLTMWRRTN